MRLTLWYTAAMAIVLIAFAVGVYGLMEHSLDEQFEVFDEAARHGQPPPDTSDIPDAELHELLVAILIGLPIALVVSAIGGYSLARRALRPVEQISAQAQTISAERLGRRLPVESPDDELGHLARVLNDLLGRLETSFEQMRRFTADASHELRTPLTTIRSVGEGALRGQDVNPAGREVIGSMLEEVERLTTLVDALLTLSRAEGGHVPLRREPFVLFDLTQEVATHLSVLAEDKRQHIDLRNDDGLAPIRADRAVLREALINLLDNAIKYSPEGAHIGVRLYGTDGRAATVEISDQGPGIPPEHQARIFERFYRIDKARSRDMGGAGLGLAIAKWAIDVHGGSIQVECPPGGGSTFRVVLPVDPPAAADRAAATGFKAAFDELGKSKPSARAGEA
jgi:heavy metal sensor kinase